VGIEKLAGVEGAVAARLEPDWEVVLIEAFVDELWVAACIKSVQPQYWGLVLERD
jgi:hypothetical protein